MFKKFAIYTALSLIVSSVLIAAYLLFPRFTNTFDYKIRDMFFTYRGEMPPNHNIVIADIDEESLKAFGQWPWSRNHMAKMVQNLTDAKVAVIGMDIVFAEEDRTSPSLIAKKLNIEANLENYDLIFADTVSTSPVILGYSFDIVNEDSAKQAPKIPVIFIEKNKPEDKNYAVEAFGAVLNIPSIQNSAYSSGFFSIIPDEDGVIRSAPLIISFKDAMYPSLSLEMIRAVTGEKRIWINYDESGISNISLGDIVIPTDRFGRMAINYRGGEKSFKYISAKDIYTGQFDAKSIEGAMVLFGTSAAGLLDLRTTPFEPVYPGVEVHANIIDNILSGDFIFKPSYIDGFNVLVILALPFIIVMSVTFVNFYIKILISFSATFAYLATSYHLLFDKGIIINIIFPLLAIAVSFVTTIVFDFFYNIKNEKAIKSKFASKVSKSVMEDILKNLESNELNIKSKEVTIFFSDIRGFTQISEKLRPEELISLLNRYMQPMSEIIIKHQGTIDKFIGDAIMAYWNAPVDLENHADMALKSALEQFEALKNLNAELDREGLPNINIGIGINTGEVIVGEMGCAIRSDYTVIGDSINLGSRVESLCKFYGSKLNITNFTKDKLKGEYIFKFLDLVRVKGKKEPIEIWQVLGEGSASGELKKELDEYDDALKLYKNSDFVNALEIFKRLENSAVGSDKVIYKIYIDRCERFIKTPPVDFDGVFDHTTK